MSWLMPVWVLLVVNHRLDILKPNAPAGHHVVRQRMSVRNHMVRGNLGPMRRRPDRRLGKIEHGERNDSRHQKEPDQSTDKTPDNAQNHDSKNHDNQIHQHGNSHLPVESLKDSDWGAESDHRA